MADNNKPHDFEEEFDFDPDIDQNDDIFEEGNPKTSASSNPFLSSENKTKFTLPILIGMAVAIFIGWKLYGFMFPSTADSQLDKIAAEESAAIQATHQSVIPVKPVQMPLPTVAVEIAAPPAKAPEVIQVPTTPVGPIGSVGPSSTMAPLSNQTQDEVKQLEHTVNQVMDSLNKMDQKISLIGREFFAVSDNVARLSQEMAQLKAAKSAPQQPTVQKIPYKINKPTKKVHHPKKNPPVVYHIDQEQEQDLIEEPSRVTTQKVNKTQRKADFVIHAIIPGRAWLRAPDGSTLTVTQGDTIPGYGKAMVIDAPSASVVTSSGVVLR